MASKRKTLFYHLAAASLWATVLFPGSATAGPPYRTDDPEPVELHHWEFYTFTTGTHITGDTSGVGPRMVKKLKLPKDREFVELRCKLAEAPENVR
jgi:hypothetical protein